MSCLEGLIVKAHVSSRKLGPESAHKNKRITGADYIKPDELLVNIRTSNVQSLDYSLLALSDVCSFVAAAALDFGFVVPRAVFLCLLAGALSASPGARGL